MSKPTPYSKTVFRGPLAPWQVTLLVVALAVALWVGWLDVALLLAASLLESKIALRQYLAQTETQPSIRPGCAHAAGLVAQPPLLEKRQRI